MKKRIINKKVVLLKTFLYRVLRVVSNVILFGFLLDNWNKALQYNIWLTLLATAQYFIFDYIFGKNKDTTVHTEGTVVWFTGLPCSGKSTIADNLSKKLFKSGYRVERLDGDIVRNGKLSNDLGFSKEDRDKNINRITFVSKLLSRNGTIVLASFVSPYRKTRNNIRKSTTNYIEVYVKASAEECAKRDVKGMWKQAKEGKIKGFTGYDDPYEKPNNPEIICDTEKESLKESTNKVLTYLKERRLV